MIKEKVRKYSKIGQISHFSFLPCSSNTGKIDKIRYNYKYNKNIS